MGSRRIEVNIAGDSKSLERAFGRSARSSSKFGQALKAGAIAATGGVALATAAAFKGVRAASDLGKQISKTGVVFKKAAPEIVKWSQTTAASIGTSQRAALEATGTFGNMLVPMGLGRDAAAAMSKRLVILGADLASFNNAGTEETLDAIRSGLSGETEPLRKFGVFLNAARIEQEALNLGFEKGKGGLSAVAKAQATYALILKDTKDAQGDFARTSAGVANSERIARANIEDTAAALGNALLPVAAKALTAINKIVIAARDGWPRFKAATMSVFGVLSQYKSAILAAAAGTAAFLVVMGGFRVVAATKAAFVALNLAMAANPAIRIALGVGVLIAGIVTLYRTSETARAVMDGSFAVIRAVVVRVAAAIRSVVNAVKALASSDAVKTIGAVIAGSFRVALGMIEKVAGAIQAVANAAAAAASAVKRAFSGGSDASKTAILNPALRALVAKALGSRSPALQVALAGLNPGAGNQNLLGALKTQESAAAKAQRAALAAQDKSGGLRRRADALTPTIQALRKQIAAAPNKTKAQQDARDKLEARYNNLVAQRQRFLDAIAGREQASIGAANELQGIREQIAGIEEKAADAAKDNRVAGFDAQIALAKLTADTQDDLIAARNNEAELVTQLAAAQAAGNNALIAQLADALFGIRSDIAQQTTPGATSTAEGGKPANELTLNVYPQGAAALDPRALANAIGWQFRGGAFA